MPMYKQDLHLKEKSVRSFQEIFTDIQSNQTIKNLVEKIRNPRESSKDKLKKQLPVFYPSIDNEIDGIYIPSGIVQIDIDLKSNMSLDIELFKQTISGNPHCYFAFTSPNGGIKLGIRTDFTNEHNHTNEQTAIRFRQAYEHVIEYLLDLPNISDFIQDDCVKSLSQACFLSHDLAAYLNESAEVLVINEYCILSNSQTFRNKLDNEHDQSNLDYVTELLCYIPKSLSYHERLPVNYSVFSCLNTDTAYSILVSHWDSNPKIDKQLRDISTHLKFGSIQQLVSIAKKYGYKIKTGTSRKGIKPKPSKTTLEPLLSAEEGFSQLKVLIREFFINKKSMLINASVGLGKTRATIEEIISLPNSYKVLYLVKSYELAHQIAADINNTVQEILKNTSYESKAKRKHSVKIIKGRAQPLLYLGDNSQSNFQMCNYRPNINGVETSLATQKYIPPKTCLNDCPLLGECAYIEQFNSIENIRIATHDTYFNKPSNWSSGTKPRNITNQIVDTDEYGEVEVETYEIVEGDRNWKPDFIIVDEDIIKTDVFTEYAHSTFDSIKTIINELKNGTTLEKAISKHSVLVYQDSDANHQYPRINYTNINQYYKELSQNQYRFAYSPILNQFTNYLKTNNPELLKGISYENNQLVFRFVISKDKSLCDIPVLYLDATANIDVVNAVYGNISYHKIFVKGHPDNNIYQLSNNCISKKSLSDKSKLNNVVIGLKKLASKYQKVGLITYKKIDNPLSTDEKFPEWLSKQIGAYKYAHFGNVRGMNSFEELDCLLIVGRYSLNPSQTLNITKCIFGGDYYSTERDYKPHLVRMKNGDVMTVEAQEHLDDSFNAIYQHKSQSETIQAIGRARYIHSGGKDVYIFSNECIGTDIEITDFFEWDDYFNADENIIDETIIDKLQKLGFVENSISGLSKALMEIGFSADKDIDYYVKKNKQILADALSMSSFKLCRYNVKNHNHQNTKPKEFFVFGDDDKLKNHYLDHHKKILSLID